MSKLHLSVIILAIHNEEFECTFRCSTGQLIKVLIINRHVRMVHELRYLYLKIIHTLSGTFSASIQNSLCSFGKFVAVCSEDHTKYTSTLCGYLKSVGAVRKLILRFEVFINFHEFSQL
jgi:hypothetical protein